ncbi:MAG: 4-hydroxy-tetrahydrodipicolinate reductase [Ruminococcaceae bacterium]|nr:4-hydroxy-tetrahydrodipicolinate reductase [Oscillospiraceae bacterium]
MKIIVNGAAGFMGRELTRIIEENGHDVAALVDINGEDMLKNIKEFNGKADVIIDFSHHSCTQELISAAESMSLPLVLATTGQTPEELEFINNHTDKIPLFFSANMSLGVAMLTKLARECAKMFPCADIEIVEKHHNRKLDAPSGTALMLARAISEEIDNAKFIYGRAGQAKRMPGEIGIHALRLGDTVGEHEIIIDTGAETLSLKHTAHSRALFARGALEAALFIAGKTPGLYAMSELVASL